MTGCQSALPWLLLLLIAIPAIELAVIIQVGGLIGVWPTVISVFLTAIIGISLIKPQMRTLVGRLQQRMADGEPPREETFHGLCLGAAGLMLLFPGFVSDTVGFLLLLPPLRDLIYRSIHKRMSANGGQSGSPGVVEGEFVEIVEEDMQVTGRKDDDDMPPPRGGWS